jgi:hypothetical protein
LGGYGEYFYVIKKTLLFLPTNTNKMTHSAKMIATTFLLTLAFSTESFAQQAYAAAQPSYTTNTMALETDDGTKAILAGNPATEARFTALFPNASNKQWSVGADNYWVTFLDNGRKANASFTPKGKVNYVIIDCGMEQLPAAFGKTIKKEYAAYSLFNAIEIRAYGAVMYQAILEDSHGFTTLRYDTDGVDAIQYVRKQ